MKWILLLTIFIIVQYGKGRGLKNDNSLVSVKDNEIENVSASLNETVSASQNETVSASQNETSTSKWQFIKNTYSIVRNSIKEKLIRLGAGYEHLKQCLKGLGKIISGTAEEISTLSEQNNKTGSLTITVETHENTSYPIENNETQ